MEILAIIAGLTMGANLIILALMLKMYTEIMKQWNQKR